MASPLQMVHRISTSKIKPSPSPESIKNQRIHLTPWGLACLSTHYIQWGLLFTNSATDQLINRLKTSLSAALCCHFHPLIGRLRTEKTDGGLCVFLDVDGGEGVEFIHAIANNVTVADVAATDEVLPLTRSFFALNGAVAYDAHLQPLLAVQVTELADGFFLGCSFNHSVGDGTSFMNFLESWAEVCCNKHGDRNKGVGNVCIHDKWLIENVKPPIRLPFSHPNEFVDRFSPPPELRERMFHLSPRALDQLKWEANHDQCNIKINKISAFQALCSLIWRSVCHARRLQPVQKTTCRIAANNRQRLSPQLPDEYFGCAAVFLYPTTTVGELLGHGLGWGANLVRESVVAHTDSALQAMLKAWMERPTVNRLSGSDWSSGLTIGSSPRFDLYGCDFGWGGGGESGCSEKWCCE